MYISKNYLVPNIKRLLLIAVLGLILFISTSSLKAQNLDVPYVPTPQSVVEQMLDLADVNTGDYVIDLGSGDGRIVIAAAKRGATGHGIDLDPDRIAEARENAADAEVTDRVMFIEGNIFDTNFSNASVITMYLLPTVNEKLRPELLEKLEPGTRVISHSFDMDEWKADKKVVVDDGDGSGTHTIYFWVIPAKASGKWGWKNGGKNFTMNIEQQFQEITASLSDGNGNSYRIKSAQLRGKRITIRAVNDNNHLYICSGRIEGDEIVGVLQHHQGEQKTFSTWSASKN